MKKSKKTPAETTRAFAKAFPPDPRQAEFLKAATALRAEELAGGTATKEAMTGARAEFGATLQAIIYPPPDARFYLIWSASPIAKLLAGHVNNAWHQSSGEYGDRPPMHWHAKK